jgi:hypothetical protein
MPVSRVDGGEGLRNGEGGMRDKKSEKNMEKNRARFVNTYCKKEGTAVEWQTAVTRRVLFCRRRLLSVRRAAKPAAMAAETAIFRKEISLMGRDVSREWMRSL